MRRGGSVPEKEFEREVLDRLAVIETKLDPIVHGCRDCQRMLNQHSIDLATVAASSKSAHYRIDGVYKTAAGVSAAVGLTLQAISFLLQRGG